ncbi:uncharacterized protein An11g08300 [Aspergillus niger]|uniref:Contig An11c0270, genomic contig n=2 Tax=Aspergillus niger TaxID=5061 RepID=A2QXB4_ASPNC|nr:uncharacterized protein An11g08300 [Aspergillus niger]CAK46022.1 unnamed protein product [Aspergillus niger]
MTIQLLMRPSAPEDIWPMEGSSGAVWSARWASRDRETGGNNAICTLE